MVGTSPAATRVHYNGREREPVTVAIKLGLTEAHNTPID